MEQVIGLGFDPSHEGSIIAQVFVWQNMDEIVARKAFTFSCVSIEVKQYSISDASTTQGLQKKGMASPLKSAALRVALFLYGEGCLDSTTSKK